MFNLTILESQVLKAFPVNYTCADDELSDNCTFTDVSDLTKTTGIAPNIIKGVLGSLAKKGLIESYSIHKSNDSVVLSDSGIYCYYS